MKRAWYVLRSALLWFLSLLHFAIAVPILIVLAVFLEAKRTRDGRVDEFQDGAFRVAQQLEIPIVPVSIVGSFQHHRTGHWMFWPATITVHLHDTIDTSGMTKENVPELRARIRNLVREPVEESLKNPGEEKPHSGK